MVNSSRRAASSDDVGADTVGAASGRGPVGWMALVAAASSDDVGAETVGNASGGGPVGWMALVAAAAGGGT